MADFEVKRGNTWKRIASILDTDGNPFNFTGCTVWWTLKLATDDSDDDSRAILSYYWTGSGSSGIIISNPTSGDLSITLSSTITSSLKSTVGYKYDIKIKDAAGDITTVDKGTMSFVDVVTIRETIP